MRNPNWHRDETILALDLYFKTEPGKINARNTHIIELSELLNKLPIHDERPDEIKFRNPNGVTLKLSNFLAIDPSYDGKGMEAFSKLDKSVFEEFQNDKSRLARIAEQIKSAVHSSRLVNKLYEINDEEDEEAFMVKEGKVIYKLHKHIERDSRINKKKKSQYFKKYGKLDCEVCEFDFFEKYGEVGRGFIECHHRKPLHELQEESKTSLKDLALVCANCHRMLHRGFSTLTIDALRIRLNNSFPK